jgi:hypothetical protein
MKILLLLLLPLFGKSQNIEFNKAKNLHEIGTDFQIVSVIVLSGTVAVASSQTNYDFKKSKPLVFGGIGLFLTGIILHEISSQHLHKGLSLQGNTLVLKLHK